MENQLRGWIRLLCCNGKCQQHKNSPDQPTDSDNSFCITFYHWKVSVNDYLSMVIWKNPVASWTFVDISLSSSEIIVTIETLSLYRLLDASLQFLFNNTQKCFLSATMFWLTDFLFCGPSIRPGVSTSGPVQMVVPFKFIQYLDSSKT